MAVGLALRVPAYRAALEGALDASAVDLDGFGAASLHGELIVKPLSGAQEPGDLMVCL